MNTLRSYMSFLVCTFPIQLQYLMTKRHLRKNDGIVTNFWIFRHHGLAVADGISQYSAGDPASSQWQCTSHRYLPPPLHTSLFPLIFPCFFVVLQYGGCLYVYVWAVLMLYLSWSTPVQYQYDVYIVQYMLFLNLYLYVISNKLQQCVSCYFISNYKTICYVSYSDILL